MDTRFNIGPIANFRWEIQGKISRFSPMGLVFCCLLKARGLLDAHKELILPLLFFVLEVVSVVLDQIGKDKVAILLVAFLLSAFGFAITLYSFIRFYGSIKKARPGEINLAEIQLKVVDIFFSVIQLIVTCIQFSLTVFKVKSNYNATAFPLASAMISVVFIFIKRRNITDSSPTLPIRNHIQLAGSSTTAPLFGSTPIEELAESSTTAPLLGSTPIEELAESSTAAPPLGSTPIEEPAESSTTAPRLGSTPIEEPAESSTTAPLLGSTPNEEPAESSTTAPPLVSTPNEEPESSTTAPLLGSTPTEEPAESSTTDPPLVTTPIEPDSSPTYSPLGSTPIEPDSSTTDLPLGSTPIEPDSSPIDSALVLLLLNLIHHQQIHLLVLLLLNLIHQQQIYILQIFQNCLMVHHRQIHLLVLLLLNLIHYQQIHLIEPDSSPTDSLLGSTPVEPDSSTTDSPIENLQQPIGSTTSIHIELDQTGTSTNQVNPARSSIVKRRRHSCKQIACRDYPHPRHDCAIFPFSTTAHELHCDQCHCYVCDKIAPCSHWGTGVYYNDHCHATEKEAFWKSQRKSFKLQKDAPLLVQKVPDTSLSKIDTIIFSKVLFRSDIESKRLHIPTSALEHIEIPEGESQVRLMVMDTTGKEWSFLLRVTWNGQPNLSFTKGWFDFVRAKDLRIGDVVTLTTMQEDEDGAPQFRIRAVREIILMGKSFVVDLLSLAASE